MRKAETKQNNQNITIYNPTQTVISNPIKRNQQFPGIFQWLQTSVVANRSLVCREHFNLDVARKRDETQIRLTE